MAGRPCSTTRTWRRGATQVRSMLVSFWFVLFRLWRTCTGAAALDTFSVALFVVASHAAAHEDPLAARIENMEQGRRKKKKKAGCMSFLSPRVGKRKEKKQDPQGPVDIGAGLTEIPGGLAGIRARMAEMGHHMNAPPPPPAMGQEFGDFAPGDEFEADAAPAGPNAPRAHQETMAGEGFVLMSDFCTEDGKQARPTPAPAARRQGAARKGREGPVPVAKDARPEASGRAVPPRAQDPARAPSPDILARKNEDGTDMTMEQLLDFFMTPSQPGAEVPVSSHSSTTAASNPNNSAAAQEKAKMPAPGVASSTRSSSSSSSTRASAPSGSAQHASTSLPSLGAPSLQEGTPVPDATARNFVASSPSSCSWLRDINATRPKNFAGPGGLSILAEDPDAPVMQKTQIGVQRSARPRAQRSAPPGTDTSVPAPPAASESQAPRQPLSAAVLPEEPKMPPPPRDDGASLASFGKREYASNIKPSSAKQQRSINAAQAPAEERPLSALPRGARLSDGVRGEQGANARGAEASSVMTPPRTHSSTHSSPRVSVTPPSEFKTQLAELRRLHTQMDTREDADAPPSAVQAHDGARGSGTPWNISAYPHAASSTQGLEVPPSISAYTDSEYTRLSPASQSQISFSSRRGTDRGSVREQLPEMNERSTLGDAHSPSQTLTGAIAQRPVKPSHFKFADLKPEDTIPARIRAFRISRPKYAVCVCVCVCLLNVCTPHV
eukprot:Tamp_04778.p1 GENE.Tamp_04778~~Tamp_04778.p1  ORF type:complete len:731 (+),score=93.67 Tamp_04778:23-2194(+)